MRTVDCDYCGKPMLAVTARKRFCSASCRQAAYRNAPIAATPYRNTGLCDPTAGLRPYVWPTSTSNPGALQGDDYPLTCDSNGYPELPPCLDRRRNRFELAA
jgi:hypothetical protein